MRERSVVVLTETVSERESSVLSSILFGCVSLSVCLFSKFSLSYLVVMLEEHNGFGDVLKLYLQPLIQKA